VERTAWEIIDELEKKYANDKEALDTVEMAKLNVRYIEKEEKKGNYKGQSAVENALECEAFLQTWY